MDFLRAWWSLPVIVSVLYIRAGKCPSAWIHRAWASLEKFVPKLGFAAGHLRLASPTSQANAARVLDQTSDPPRQWRCTPAQCLSTAALLAVAVKFSAPVRSHRDAGEASAWKAIVAGLLAVVHGADGEPRPILVGCGSSLCESCAHGARLLVDRAGIIDVAPLLRDEAWGEDMRPSSLECLGELPEHCALLEVVDIVYRVPQLHRWWVGLLRAVAVVIESCLPELAAASGHPKSTDQPASVGGPGSRRLQRLGKFANAMQEAW